MMNPNYQTLLEALEDLKKRGFTLDFNLNKGTLYNSDQQICLDPDDFEIVEYHRFEGASDPGDSSVVYAIKSDKHHVKGVFVNAYGVYSDDMAEGLIKKLNTP